MRSSAKSTVWVETPCGKLAEMMSDSNMNLGGAL